MFVLQSAWAVAAQYCQHEKNVKVDHIGHHTHEHNPQTADIKIATDQNTADNIKADVDTDCPYCHLGSIKSMIVILPIFDAQIQPVELVDIFYSYPEIIPLKPERPNWSLAI